jgi:hypothetical protein
MARISTWLIILFLLTCQRLVAIENYVTSGYNQTAPTSSNITNWQTGWAQPAVQPTGTTYTTGWNYVGLLGQLSGTYLGNGWVITCAHVGAGNFVLNGTTYPMVANSTHSFYAPNGTPYDIVVFQVSPAPALPALPLRMTDPVAGSSKVAMIGNGGGPNGAVETWGYDTVTYANVSVPLNNIWTTNDFETANSSPNDKYEVVSTASGGGGDSGGGDFICNSTTSQWELTGLNEAELTNGTNGPEVGSAFVQLDTYAAQIEAIVAPPPLGEPTMPQWALILLGGLLFIAAIPKAVLRRR